MDMGVAVGRVPFESLRCGSKPVGRKFMFVVLFISGFRFDAILFAFICFYRFTHKFQVPNNSTNNFEMIELMSLGLENYAN